MNTKTNKINVKNNNSSREKFKNNTFAYILISIILLSSIALTGITIYEVANNGMKTDPIVIGTPICSLFIGIAGIYSLFSKR